MKNDILFQLEIAWQLFLYHCDGLHEKEALWCKTSYGLQIRETEGTWIADWPETEAYSIGPSSIAWILWHMMYWWKSVLSASKSGDIIKKEEVLWPGSAALAIQEIVNDRDEWIDFLKSLSESDLQSSHLCRWPFEGKSMTSLALWLNVELMKNAAEIGSARFLFASMEQGRLLG